MWKRIGIGTLIAINLFAITAFLVKFPFALRRTTQESNGRLLITANPGWKVRQDSDRLVLERGWLFPFADFAKDTITLHVHDRCLPAGQAEANRNNILEKLNRPNRPAAQSLDISTTAGTLACFSLPDSSEINGEVIVSTFCSLSTDGSGIIYSGRKSSRSEALGMFRSLRESSPCVPASK